MREGEEGNRRLSLLARRRLSPRFICVSGGERAEEEEEAAAKKAKEERKEKGEEERERKRERKRGGREGGEIWAASESDLRFHVRHHWSLFEVLPDLLSPLLVFLALPGVPGKGPSAAG